MARAGRGCDLVQEPEVDGVAARLLESISPRSRCKLTFSFETHLEDRDSLARKVVTARRSCRLSNWDPYTPSLNGGLYLIVEK